MKISHTAVLNAPIDAVWAVDADIAGVRVPAVAVGIAAGRR
jgi:hypothetical protein